MSTCSYSSLFQTSNMNVLFNQDDEPNSLVASQHRDEQVFRGDELPHRFFVEGGYDERTVNVSTLRQIRQKQKVRIVTPCFEDFTITVTFS